MPQSFTYAKGINPENRLFATAFLLSHERYIDPDKFDYRESAPARDQLFAEWKSYQRPIEEIEELTKLKFRYGAGNGRSLAEVDPFAEELRKPPSRRRRGRRTLDVSESMTPVNSGVFREDGSIEGYGDIVLP